MYEDSVLFVAIHALMFVSVALLGLVTALVGWGGARAGVIVGVVVGFLGVVSLIYTLFSPWPRLWWISVVPIYAGWLAVAAWRSRAEPIGRQPFRFGLRGLLLFLVAVCVPLGGVATYYRQEQAEQLVAAELKPGKGSVYSNVFGRVVSAILSPENEQDFLTAVATLRQLHELRVLQIDNGAILPGSVTRHLGKLTALRTLFLQHVPVLDADLEPLGNLQRLEILELEASDLTDEGLPHLYPLKRLKQLHLYHADPRKITPQAIQQLHAQLPKLPPGYP